MQLRWPPPGQAARRADTQADPYHLQERVEEVGILGFTPIAPTMTEKRIRLLRAVAATGRSPVDR